MSKMIIWLKKRTGKHFDIMKSYGQQEDEKNCFSWCLKYICLLFTGYNFKNKQYWKYDSEERKNKKC